MNRRRSVLMTMGEIAHDIIASPEVGEAWDEPSALAGFSVRGLAGHLLRGTGSVLAYLERPEPDGPSASPAEYYALAVEDPEQSGSAPALDSALHRAIRARGEEAAANGHADLVKRSEETLRELRARLASEPEERRLSVFKGIVLTLDDYLATRIVELTVHVDDLAVSVGIPTPELPPEATSIAVATLVDVARHRHGDLAVLRALTRRERDEPEALRVL